MSIVVALRRRYAEGFGGEGLDGCGCEGCEVGGDMRACHFAWVWRLMDGWWRVFV